MDRYLFITCTETNPLPKSVWAEKPSKTVGDGCGLVDSARYINDAEALESAERSAPGYMGVIVRETGPTMGIIVGTFCERDETLHGGGHERWTEVQSTLGPVVELVRQHKNKRLQAVARLQEELKEREKSLAFQQSQDLYNQGWRLFNNTDETRVLDIEILQYLSDLTESSEQKDNPG